MSMRTHARVLMAVLLLTSAVFVTIPMTFAVPKKSKEVEWLFMEEERPPFTIDYPVEFIDNRVPLGAYYGESIHVVYSRTARWLLIRRTLPNGKYRVTIFETQTGTAEIYNEAGDTLLDVRDWWNRRVYEGIVDFQQDHYRPFDFEPITRYVSLFGIEDIFYGMLYYDGPGAIYPSGVTTSGWVNGYGYFTGTFP